MNDTQRFTLFRKDLLRWFAENRRPLPWRADYTPYRTWIAEVMMQQTQMDRGVQYFLRWMERFPDVAAVAAAPEEDLLKAWEGLGYYRRARNIQAAARVIMERHGGNFPTSYADILALPGVGPYTAGAIASTAYNEEVPCVDGNVERVLSRVFDIDTPVKEEPAKSRIRELAQALIPKGEARNFNQGLMELGALVCRKKPECERCPLAGLCESRHLGIQNERPVPGKKAAVTQIEVVCGVLLHEGKVFIQRRNEKDVWGGLWEFPGGCVEPGETPGTGRRARMDGGSRLQGRHRAPAGRHPPQLHDLPDHPALLPAQAGGQAQRMPVPEELARGHSLPVDRAAGHRGLPPARAAPQTCRQL